MFSDRLKQTMILIILLLVVNKRQGRRNEDQKPGRCYLEACSMQAEAAGSRVKPCPVTE